VRKEILHSQKAGKLYSLMTLIQKVIELSKVTTTTYQAPFLLQTTPILEVMKNSYSAKEFA